MPSNIPTQADSPDFYWDASTRSVRVHRIVAESIAAQAMLYANADTLDAAVITTVETPFATAYNIPANFFDVGKLIRATFGFQFTSSGVPPGGTLRMKLGGTQILSVSMTAPTNKTNNGFGIMLNLLGTLAPAASAPIDVNFVQPYLGGSSVGQNTVAQPVSLATNSILALTCTIQYGAGTAGNTFSLRQLLVEAIG